MRTLSTALLTFATAIAIDTCAHAQVVPLAAATGCYAQVGGVVQAIPLGTDVTSGVNVAAGTGGGSAFLRFVPDQDATAITFTYDAGSVAVAATTARASCDLRHDLWSARPLAGRFIVGCTTTTSGTGTVQIGIDLGDDGFVDATGPAVIPCTLAAGATPIRVRLTTNATAGTVAGPWGIAIAYQGSAHTQLLLRFEPTHCIVQALGGGCPGPQLTALGNLAGGVDLQAILGPGGDLAVLLLAFAPTLALPPQFPTCALLAAPVTTSWALPDAAHTVLWSLTWPSALGAVAFTAQAVGLRTGPFGAAATGALGLATQPY